MWSGALWIPCGDGGGEGDTVVGEDDGRGVCDVLPHGCAGASFRMHKFQIRFEGFKNFRKIFLISKNITCFIMIFWLKKLIKVFNK